MKPTDLIPFLILALFTSTASSAQVPLELGTKWYHDRCCVFSPPFDHDGYRITEYVGDTVVNGLQCAHLQVEQVDIYTDNYYGYGQEIHESQFSTFYHQSGDSVFEVNAEGSFLSMDYGAAIGDSWLVNPPNLFDEPVAIRVDSTEQGIVAGQLRRTVYASFSLPWEEVWIDAGPYIEGIGRMTGEYDFSEFLLRYAIADIGMSDFCAYDIPSSQTDPDILADCSRIPVGQPEWERLAYRISGNPSDGRFFLSLDQATDVRSRLFTVQGIQLSSEMVVHDAEGLTVDLRSLGSGVYLLAIFHEQNGRHATVTLVKR